MLGARRWRAGALYSIGSNTNGSLRPKPPPCWHRMTISSCLRPASVLFALLWLSSPDVQPAASASSPISLDVPGRTDATPSVAASGSFVAVAWGASAGGKTDVFLAVSRDGGSTFGSPVQVNPLVGEARLGGELPPRVALVARRGVPVPEIVVLWTARSDTTAIKLVRSRDGGKTFSAPSTLQSSSPAGDRGWPALALDPTAKAHAIWLDHRGLAANRATGTGQAAHQAGGQHDGVAMAQKSGLYYASATTKPMPERLLTNGVCYCCKTALAAGPNGSLYAAWRHVYPGNLRDMAFAMSRDGGRSFSAPVRVSEDGWAINGCPDDGPAIAVDTRGAVHLVWPTVIDGPTPEGALFYASTRDGRRFTPRIRIPTLGGPKPSHPQIVIDRAGGIFVAWDETLNGARVSAVRDLRPQSDRAPAFGEAMMLSPNGPSVYPVLAATDKGLVAVWSTGGDTSRIEVRTLPMR